MRPHHRDLLLLCCLTLGVYYVSLFAPFNSLDDRGLITFLINKEEFIWTHYFFPTGTHSYYRPLIGLTYEFDKHAWGLTEPFMHLENILLHLLNVLLVYQLARQLSRSYLAERPRLFTPFAVAALFALHPLNTEAVNWITARTDLLAGTFILMALWCVFRAIDRDAMRWAWAGSLLLMLGAMCKETALFLVPGVFWLVQVRPERSAAPAMPMRRRWLLLSIVLLGAGAYLALRLSAQWHDQGLSIAARALTAPQQNLVMVPAMPQPAGDAPPAVETGRSTGNPVISILAAIGFYTKKLIWPWPLNFGINRVPPGYCWLGAAVCLLLLWFVWIRRIWSALCLTGFGLLSVVLVISLAPVAWTPVAERYAYIPLAVTILGLLAINDRSLLPHVKRFKAWILVVFLVIMGGSTLARNFVWLDNLALYQDTVKKSPDFAPAQNELALALYEQGRTSEAIAILKSVRNPGSQLSSLNQVAALIEARDYSQAKRFLLDRLTATPVYERTILEYLVKVNDLMIETSRDPHVTDKYYREQLVWLEHLGEISGDAFYWYRQGRIHLHLHENEQARRCFAKALKGLPEHSPFYEPARKLAQEPSR